MSETTNAGSNPHEQHGSTDAIPVRRRRVGLNARAERALGIGGFALCGAFAIAWSWSITNASAAERRGEPVPSPTRTVTAALTSSAPAAAFVTDVAVEAIAARLRGKSGKLRAQTALPDEVDNALSALNNFAQVTLTPFGEKRGGRLGTYLIGSWPGEQRGGARGPAKAPAGRYGNPRGFIKVTPENLGTQVSDHFRLRDFLTKNQPNVWPKYLVLELRLIDKLELVLSDLAARGVRVEGVAVMSGFRTPSYNEGGGNTAGRAGLSRHMYGDASDIYIDNDRNGTMDDLNRDGRVDIHDARFIQESVDRVERAHPELVGGTGVYVACCGHGPFIHIDTRGYRARWTGSGGG